MPAKIDSLDGAFRLLAIAASIASWCNRDGLADLTSRIAHARHASTYKPPSPGDWHPVFASVFAQDSHIKRLPFFVPYDQQ